MDNKKILVVDDNRISLKITKELISEYGLECEHAESGSECIELISEGNKYLGIFLDDMMPGMTGMQTMIKLKRDLNYDGKIIVITANDIEGEKEQYIKAGFDYYISKPIKKEELEEAIRILL